LSISQPLYLSIGCPPLVQQEPCAVVACSVCRWVVAVPAPCTMHHAPCTMHHALAMHHSPCCTRYALAMHSLCTTRYAALTMHHSLCTTRHDALAMHSPCTRYALAMLQPLRLDLDSLHPLLRGGLSAEAAALVFLPPSMAPACRGFEDVPHTDPAKASGTREE
jgi:hypothetical protein